MISYCEVAENRSRGDLYADNWRWAKLTDYARIGRCMSRFVWSPIVWRDGKRKGDNFLGALYCVLDFDDGFMSLAEAINEVFADYKHIIGTTRSHQCSTKDGKPIKKCDRFRVLLEFEKPIFDLHTYSNNMQDMIERYDTDDSCKDGARFFYSCDNIMSTNACKDSLLVQVKTFEKDEEEFNLETYEQWRKDNIFPSTYYRWQRGVYETGRNNTAYGVARDLAKCGYSLPEIQLFIKKSPIFENADGAHKRGMLRTCQSALDNLKSTLQKRKV